jgi:hypothetical protein
MDHATLETTGAAARMMAGRSRSRRLGVGLAGAALVVLTLNGSVAFAASPAAATTDGPTATEPSAPLDPAATDEAFAKFTACMRDHGIDMSDPVKLEAGADAGPGFSTGGSSGATIVVGGSAQAVAIPGDAKAFEAANAACASILEAAGIGTGSAPSVTVSSSATLPVPADGSAVTGGVVLGAGAIGGGDVTAQADEMKAYAACMRSHGVDVPDPVVDTKAGTVQLRFDADPASDAFQTANAACATEAFDFPLPAAPPTTTR